MSEKKREDIETTNSSLPGIAGIIEGLIRRFRNVVPIVVLSMIYLLGAVCMGIALLPAVYFIHYTYQFTHDLPQVLHLASLSIAIGIGYFLFGFTLIVVIPLVNFVLRLRLKPWRGIYYSLGTVPWFLHNALAYIVRYAFLKFITPTPFNIAYLRWMGMKIGKGTQVNTTNISDPSLLELEDNVTIGGSATLICHYGAGGFLIIEPVRIRKGATIGLRAIIMGDVEIGAGAKVLANSVVMPKTRIPAGEVWAGVPAQCIRKAEQEE